MTPQKVITTFNLVKNEIICVQNNFLGFVGRCMPNFGHGGPSGTRDMTIFMFYVSAQILSIEYFEIYRGPQAPGGISFFVS